MCPVLQWVVRTIKKIHSRLDRLNPGKVADLN